MCHPSCLEFSDQVLSEDIVYGRKVLEIGAINVNGSVRDMVEKRRPALYVGVDIAEGAGVDVVCSCEDVVARFGPASFDIVIATEMLEHVKEWRKSILAMKEVCRPGGSLLITTRSRGFQYHGYPGDYWRYDVDDMKLIFSDFDIRRLEQDPSAPGVFVWAQKPPSYDPASLNQINLYSVVAKRRVSAVRWFHIFVFSVWYYLRWTLWPQIRMARER